MPEITEINDRFALTFTVEEGEFKVEFADHFESRCHNAIAIIKEVIGLAPAKFEGRRGYVNFFDFPPSPPREGEYDLLFCSTRWHHEPSRFLPFPSGNSIGWPQVGIPDGAALIDDFLACQSPPQDDRIFWIGANTHSSRVALAALGKRHPTAIDAELMEWDRSGVTTQLSSKTRYVSMWDHRLYKYLIDCPGTGYSGRLRWLLATGRPVFIVDRPAIEHWHARMKPWVHYVPVRPDLSDLMYSYKRLEEDPELYRSISENAKAFVRANLARGREVAYIASVVPAAEL